MEIITSVVDDKVRWHGPTDHEHTETTETGFKHGVSHEKRFRCKTKSRGCIADYIVQDTEYGLTTTRRFAIQ